MCLYCLIIIKPKAYKRNQIPSEIQFSFTIIQIYVSSRIYSSWWCLSSNIKPGEGFDLWQRLEKLFICISTLNSLYNSRLSVPFSLGLTQQRYASGKCIAASLAWTPVCGRVAPFNIAASFVLLVYAFCQKHHKVRWLSQFSTIQKI